MTAVDACLHAELVATLVHGARDRYLAGHPPSRELRALLDGLQAGSVTLRQVRAGDAHPGEDAGMASSPLVSVVETAHTLGISRRTLERRLADGTIPSTKLGGRRLIPRAALDALASR